MDPAKEKMAAVQSAMQQCLSAEDEPKVVQEGFKTDSTENAKCSKERELEERERKVAAMERALEEKRKILEQKSLDLSVREKKLEEKSEGKAMRVNVKIESPRAKPGSAEEMKEIHRKRSRKILEMVESSTSPQASGTKRNVQVQDGLSFLLTIMQTHEIKDAMTVPSYFVAAYDLCEKKSVILSTDEGDFGLEVKHYGDPRRKTSRHVTFSHGWREFYCKNRLSIGTQCLFKVKEHTVDGDASVFSMEVSVLSR